MQDLRGAAFVGLVAGGVLLYLTAVGIVLAFAERNVVTGVVTLGRLMLAAAPLVAGYVTARRGPLPGKVATGLVAGAMTGVVVAAALLFASAVNVRPVLVRVSPGLLDFVAYEQEALVGAAINVALGALLGILGALLRVAPIMVRSSIGSSSL